ncbi:MAG: efflux RND transporter periplasmic adaptor subunit [Candidatus Cloacimonadaceae bacterium]
MKKKKVLKILVLSLIFIAITIIVSYIYEAQSLKLPAVIFSDKVIVSSEVDGILREYFVTSMQKVKPNDLLAEMDNSKLPYKLETLQNEKNKYEELVKSAKSGDYLKTELYKLDEDIFENEKDFEEAKLDIVKINNKLKLIEDRYTSSKKIYDANLNLHEQGILNSSEFEKAADNYWDVHEQYYELKSDSLVAAQTMKSSQSIIRLLKARKDILSNNVDILAAKHLIDLNEVEANIHDLQVEIKNLKVYSPIAGIVTDINHRPGEKIDEGDVIAEIADLNNVWVIAYGSSSSRQKVKPGQKVRIFSDESKNIWGRVTTVSPVMEKVKSLSTSFETVNTFTKIEIKFDDMAEALKYITPGERLFVRIYYKTGK